MSQQAETTDIKKKILTTGIRVGTQVKTKFMKPFITKASPEGLYMLDLDITLEKIQTAAKFINRLGTDKLIVCSDNMQKHQLRSSVRYQALKNSLVDLCQEL